jgi:hypothetical protein
MKTISSLDGLSLESRNLGTGPTTFFPAVKARKARSRVRRNDVLPLREAISLWFAVSSPLIGILIGFLGAWFVTWLTS